MKSSEGDAGRDQVRVDKQPPSRAGRRGCSRVVGRGAYPQRTDAKVEQVQTAAADAFKDWANPARQNLPA